MRRAREEPGRVRRKHGADGLRHDLGELVFFDAIPDIEQKPAASLEDTARFPIGADPVRKEHRAELTDYRVEALVFERQALGVRLPPDDAPVRAMPAGGPVEHRLIQIANDVMGVAAEERGQRASDDAGAGGRFQKARRIGRSGAACKIGCICFEEERHEIGIVDVRD